MGRLIRQPGTPDDICNSVSHHRLRGPYARVSSSRESYRVDLQGGHDHAVPDCRILHSQRRAAGHSSDPDTVARYTGCAVSLFPHVADCIEAVRESACEVVQDTPVSSRPCRIGGADRYRHLAQVHLPSGQFRAALHGAAHSVVSQGSPHA